MNFNEYQKEAWTTAQYPEMGSNLLYPALGLSGEAGEVSEKIKKLWRNNGITSGEALSLTQSDELAKELSDVLWYVSALSKEIGYDLETIAVMNINKLRDRQKRGVIKSQGDNR